MAYETTEIQGDGLFTEIQGDYNEISGDSLVGLDDYMSAGDGLVGAGQESLEHLLAIAGAIKRKLNRHPNFRAAMQARRVASGALVHERGATKSREYPMGFESAAAIAAGAAGRVQNQPQIPFRCDRVVVPSDIAGQFVLSDIKVGKNSQFAAEGNVPARVFQENAVSVKLKGDTAQTSQFVSLSFTNIGGAPAIFRAAVIGPAIE